MTTTPLLEVRGVRAGFGPTTVLHGVDLAVGEGQIVALLGLNGAGKSVTMKVVGGLVPGWDGTVLFRGTEITHLDVEDRVALGIGHAPQARQLFPELSVEENLRLGAYLLRRRAPGRYRERLGAMLDRFPKLAERRGQLAGSLSGGERAMLAVARALMSEPQLLLVDEPTAGLAPSVVDDVRELLRGVNADGVAMLLVEQQVPFALSLAHHVHVMQRGRVVHEGAADELDHETLAARLGVGRLLTAGLRGRRRP